MLHLGYNHDFPAPSPTPGWPSRNLPPAAQQQRAFCCNPKAKPDPPLQSRHHCHVAFTTCAKVDSGGMLIAAPIESTTSTSGQSIGFTHLLQGDVNV